MITDGVFHLIGSKRRRGPGHPCPCPGSFGDSFLAFIGARPTCACAAGPVGDAFLAFIGARRAAPHQ